MVVCRLNFMSAFWAFHSSRTLYLTTRRRNFIIVPFSHLSEGIRCVALYYTTFIYNNCEFIYFPSVEGGELYW